jgi:DNA-binding NarL/FixJ family response regulator
MNEPARLRPLPALDQPGDRTFERKPIAIGAILVLEAPAPVDSEDRVKAVAHSWGLSPRELQTLRHLVAGASNKQIASELGCAARTVEVHVARVLRRAGVANRTALVASFWGQQVHEEA